jgi:hypothetical protein
VTTASLTISVIGILIAVVLAWNAFGGRDDAAALRRWWRGRGRGSPHRDGR